MDIERRAAEEAYRPDMRGTAVLYEVSSDWSVRGAGPVISQPSHDGTTWWQVGNPQVTMGTHPHPLPG